MRFILPFIALALSLTGCGSRSTHTETTTATTDTPTAHLNPAASRERCFRQVIGRDTTWLRLVVDGSDVRGELAVLPYEKDRARGPIRGTLTNSQIRADWKRSGEGVTQPYELVLTLRGDTVTWREGERVEKRGKWILKNPDEGYTYTLTKVDCE